MKKNVKQTPRACSQILDSDDELPSYYEEIANLPAYKDDTRFDHIELPWLINCNPITLRDQQVKKQKRLEEHSDIEKNKDKSKILISKGNMTTLDLFYVRSIEKYCSESTLIWFINLLKSKSLTDRFHKSCLTINYFQDIELNESKPFDSFNADYYFKLIVSAQPMYL